ncbi:MAG: hypothetical protein QOJ65_897 [Fimbriimonadaceae bacterium]|jgi:hypothetical protein|nr:hypothetical protein [Fimbriimonadaceae bacterium]
MKARLFALGFAVAVLFPVAAHFTIFLFSPPPKQENFGLGTYSYNVETQAGTKQERLARAKEEDLNTKRFEVAEKHQQAIVFYGIYPIALLAIVIGTFLRTAAVGAGLIFGGIFSLADGCYASWGVVPGWVSVGSVILATIIVIAVASIYERRATSVSPP